MDAVNDEVRRILLGFDLSEVRFEKLMQFLEASLPPQLSSTFLSELAQLRTELCVFISVEQLFSRARQISESGQLGPSNSARFRGYLRRMRTQGTGVAADFLQRKDAWRAPHRVALSGREHALWGSDPAG